MDSYIIYKQQQCIIRGPFMNLLENLTLIYIYCCKIHIQFYSGTFEKYNQCNIN